MTSNQSLLPRLPVPPLQQTLSKYLTALKPLYPPQEIQKVGALTKEFEVGIMYSFVSATILLYLCFLMLGLGVKLQDRLVKYAAGEKNWLTYWWLRKAYHEYREPLVLNSNWYDDVALLLTH